MPTDSVNQQSQPDTERLPSDYYELLQVSPKADPEIIEAAYRRLALKYHPDHNPSPEAVRKMQAINAAYATLKDPQRRAEYDFRPPDPLYTGDWSEDDYVPPPRGWRHNFKKLSKNKLWPWLGWSLIALLLLAILLGGQLQLFNSNLPSTTLTGSDPTATQAVELPPGAIFFDNFENVGGANWNLDQPWHLTTRYSASGSHSLWFGEESKGRYNPGLNSSATLVRPLDLGGTAQPVLRFQLTGQSDYEQLPNNEDHLFVEVAEPGRDFQPIFSTSSLYPNWQTLTLDLARWKGKSILLRFRFSSGTLNSGAGFSGYFIDDVRVDREK